MKINDTGEVLEGARKHLWAGFNNLAVHDFDNASEDYVKSKILPKFNIEKMVAGGLRENVIVTLIVADNIIPRKPANSRRKLIWNRNVAGLMKFIKELVGDADLPLDVIHRRAVLAKTFVNFDEKLKTALSLGLNHARHMGSAFIAGGYTHPEKQTPCFVVFGPDGKFLRNVDTFGDGVSLLEPLCVESNSSSNAVKPRKKLAFHIFEDRKTEEVFIGWGGVKQNPVRVVRNIESVEKARDILKNSEVEIVAAFEKMRPSNNYWSDNQLTRQGPKWTEDEFISPEKLIDTFGLRGVQYGNYVTQKERLDLNLHTYNGMKDLADILGLPDTAIGFDGDLGFAIGARGKGGGRFSAHFEPLRFNINLTRGSGIGSFAHEFGHCLSSYLFALGKTGARNHFRVSGDISFNKDMPNFPERLALAVSGLNKSIAATQVRVRSTHLDEFRTKTYWSTAPEVFARCFERWVSYELELQGRCNGWLVSLKKSVESEYEFYPYPTQKELDGGLATAFRELFESIKVETGVFSLGKIDSGIMEQLVS